MSYNIDAVNIKEIELWATGRELRDLYEANEDNLPEGNFFEYIDLDNCHHDDPVPITSLQWYGTRSGNSYDVFMQIIRCFHGTAKFSVVWEDGDVQYCVLKDNEVTFVDPVW